MNAVEAMKPVIIRLLSRSFSGGKRRRASEGFSLVELLVVLLVMGILLTAAVGGFGGREERNQSVGLRAMADVLETARLRAISRATYVAAVFPDAASAEEEKRFRGAAVVDLEVSDLNLGGAKRFSEGLVSGGFTELPTGLVVMEQGGGAGSVLQGDRVPVQWRNGGTVEDLPAVVFGPTGSVLSPRDKSQRVVRVALGDVTGDSVQLRGGEDISKLGRVEIQRVTGKIVRID